MSGPLVTCIVPHHLNENDTYLHWCLKSVLSSVGVDLEVICLSDSKEPPSVPDEVTLVHDPLLSNVTKKWHRGLKMAHPASKYVMLISDDVMVSKYTIAEMADTVGDLGMILSPASNCDATTRYRTHFTVTNPEGATKFIHLKSTLEEMKGFEQAIIEYPKERRILIDSGWISFYCTMFPKSVIAVVGDFDEKLDVRWNDVDYCQRARKIGVPAMINLGVFALHFGDKTLPKCTTEAEYTSADQAYQEKYFPTPEDHGDLL